MAGADYKTDVPPDPDTFLVRPVVFRYLAGLETDDPGKRYQLLPNVRCLSVEFFEGARPPEAVFRYEFDPVYREDDDPRHFEDVLPVNAGGPHVAATDDRLVVRVFDLSGKSRLIFDGFAQVPQGNASRSQEAVIFQAFGTPVREWDDPLPGAVYRSSEDPQKGKDIATNRHVRFNPDGNPNATPNGYDHGSTNRGESGDRFPAFMDERIVRTPDHRRHFTLGMAARYVMFSRKVAGVDTRKWLRFYLPSFYDQILESRVPYPDAGGVIDPADPSTYRDTPIRVQDLTVTTDAWPDALAQIIEPHGFTFRFELSENSDGDPVWWLWMARKDDAVPQREIYMQPAGPDGTTVPLDVRRNNASVFAIQRDTRRLFNEFVADSAQTRYEIGVFLAPGFEIDPADADQANLPRWREGEANFDPVKYRVYHANEAGDGVWNFDRGELDFTPLDLSPVFGTPDDPKMPRYAPIRRPGRAKVFSLDKLGEPRKFDLAVSTRWPGPVPGLWDEAKMLTSGLQRVTKGGWELLPDRLGIRLTRPDLEQWVISDPTRPNDPFPSGACRVVTCQANPNAGREASTPRFYFFLVTVIEGDFGLDVRAERRAASPTKFAVRKRIDERGWFEKHVIHSSSPWLDGGPTTVVRDDTAEAQARMDALRKAHELGSVAGSVTIPRFTMGYQIGDRITRIAGRDCTLRQNMGIEEGEASSYPAVVAVRWDFDNKQETTFSLSDRRADPPPERRS